VPIETVIKPILDTVLDAVVVMDREGVIRAWNHHAEDIFGWTAEEAIGRDLGELIVPASLRHAHFNGLARFNRDGIAKVLDTRLELSGLRRDGSEIPVELSITLVSREGRDVFVGFLRDISQRRHAERQVEFRLRESRLMLDLSERASGAEKFETVLAAALDAICALADWPVGHAFLVTEDDERLQSAGWSTNAQHIAPALVPATENQLFAPGIGLPGRVLESGQPMWVTRVDLDSNFPRRGMGFESGFAFPVLSGDRCIAVLEFFSRDPREPEPALLLSARAIGAQIGRVYERKRGEELQALLLAELNHRAKNILAVVRGIAHLSFGSSKSLEEAQQTFDRRLDSIAKANDILHAQSGQSALLGDIVHEAIGGCGVPSECLAVTGARICVDSSTAMMFSLAVHELCTNAVKYGALSQEGGRIAIDWSPSEDDPSRFDFGWAEFGAAAINPPESEGFGMRILKRGMELETGGRAQVTYAPPGFTYSLHGARHAGIAADRAAA
jgi:PAS domain S-box-containing protein